MRVFPVLALLTISACSTAQTNVIPTGVILYTNSVNVIMSEGSLCAGNRPGSATEWTGTLTGCPYQYTYQARQTSRPAARLPLQKSNTSATTGPQIIVTDAKGKAHFFARP